MEDTKQQVKEILERLVPGVDVEGTPDLVKAGVIDSMVSIMLVNELEDAFDIEVTPLDMVPENFSSVQAIADFVDGKLA
ncbi:MAG: phosphopantetheine-binding protein [Atopobiaceae bacterium]|jgi:methoxymalonate biosynthesis acyl carrier protein|uniref:Phosphopantetheine-binding protein n=1 Tax=Olsenella absiana TaxID=3115222 RepID=A0ABU7R863_9ACTN|nr:phosphopantetheine-binding protein [Olsenella sp.]MDY3900993.1 phosphopantetheine-binding protein [Atopobiaceae bacterium]